jgi:transketolase
MSSESTLSKLAKLLNQGKTINGFLRYITFSHPTSCSSSAELLAALFFHPDGLHYNPQKPKQFSNDRFVISKGHGAPLLYACWAHNGFLKREQLLTLRKIDSPLEGHPTPKLEFVDVATGSLGQGLSVACGMAYASKYIDKINNRYFCLMGDGETIEGSVWEACHFANVYKLSNLTAIVDINGIGQSGATSLKHEIEIYDARFKSFGWETIVIDGHNMQEVVNAYSQVRKSTGDKPIAILAKTFKGKNFLDTIENSLAWHGKVFGGQATKVIDHLKTLIKNPNVKITPAQPDFECPEPADPVFSLPDTLDYDRNKEVAIRAGYGNALKRLAANDKNNALYALDGDTKVSTYACYLEEAYPERFIEGFIAEQNIVGVAQGLVIRKKVPFCSAFAAFFTRAFDQMRMGSISLTNVKFVGSHAGVSLGEDGASQMGLEDFAQFRSLIGSICLYPSDAIACERATELAANYKGTAYIRTSRPNSALLYANDEKFAIGKAKVLLRSENDVLTVASAGITLLEAKKAAEKLASEGINIRLIDLFSIKPIDAQTITECVKGTNNKLLVIEEHFPEGGIFEAVCSAVATQGFKIYNTSVDKLPRSGKPDELLDMFNLNAPKIIEKIRSIL